MNPEPEPRCICDHTFSSHFHGAPLNPNYPCNQCDCPDFIENFTQPLFNQ